MLHISNSAEDYSLIEAQPFAAAMGAEVSNVDLGNLSDAAFDEIEHALYRHSLLVFRNQEIGHAEHNALTHRFGSSAVDAYTEGLPDFPYIQPVIREPAPPSPVFFGKNWHTDSPFLERPPAISMLRSVETPDFGGDTAFTSTRQAYARLSQGMQNLLDGLRVYYSRSHTERAVEIYEDNPSRPFDIVPIEEDYEHAVTHPLIRTHPVTGDKALYVDDLYCIGIEGLERIEAEPILRYLVQHNTMAECQCRLRWEPGMLAMWDNRSVLHQAFSDFAPARREMYRSIVEGEVPI